MSYILEQVQRAGADSKAFFEVIELSGVEAFQQKELAKRGGLYSELLQYQVEGNKKLLSEYELS